MRAFLLYIAAICTALALPASLAAGEMHDAICNGNLAKVKQLIERRQHGINEQTKWDDGSPGSYPLELAAYCYGGHAEIANYLIDQGADVNKHQDGYNNLMWALRSVDEPDNSDPMRRVVLKMIERGAKVDHVDPDTGRTPLMGAASLGDREVVQLLMRKGASNAPKTTGDWCVSGNYDIKCTASDYARLGGHVELALEIEGRDSSTYRRTLNYAVIQGNARAVRELIEGGADVNAKEEMSNLSAVHYAVNHNRTEILRLLLDKGADPNVQDYAGVTPLRNAVVFYKRNLAKMLIDGGAKATHEQSQGCGGGLSEFGWAIEYGLHDIARYMVTEGAIDPQSPGKSFQMVYGRSEEDVGIAQLLLDRGARPTAEDVEQLKKVRAANQWIADAGHITKIIDMLEVALNEEQGPNMPEIVVRPTIDLNDLQMRTRGGTPLNIRARSMNTRPSEVQSFDQRFRSANGRLEPDAQR